ncbi:MAG: pyruvate, phosphate dikinase, partial [Acidimicrobiia bacterium]|nr:pyruvate, phosphate dikinase [Acidimicrobiia bacterium]
MIAPAASTTLRWVRTFDGDGAIDKGLLGGKGANLATMVRLGLPVPAGFTITTEACCAYLADGRPPAGLMDEVRTAIAGLEAVTGCTFGGATDPLLVSVRSGAAFSMPGMMDTVLDLGLDATTVEGLARRTGDERFALDSWRRFLQMFGRVVLGAPGEQFETAIARRLAMVGAATERDLDVVALRLLVDEFESIIGGTTGRTVPAGAHQQLEAAILAVFDSWNGRRARDYRMLEGIADDLGTAVNVQVMVFGNTGERSGTGVVFSRDPATGERRPYGDFLVDAQGEDVVAGIRTTQPLAEMATAFPDCHERLLGVLRTLERHERDMCDVEFTIENGRLFVLQTRIGKRTASAALRMAVEMVDEGLIDRREAVLRVDPSQLDHVLHPQFDPSARIEVLTSGPGASPGAAVGAVCFDADDAVTRRAAGQRVVLVRTETSPEDLHGIVAAEGILT